MTVEKPYQSFRLNGRIFWIPARYHKESEQYIVLWDDIEYIVQQDTTIVVMQGSDVVFPARDSEGLRKLEPQCIEYHRDEVLDLHLGDVFSPKITFSASAASIHGITTLEAQTSIDSLFSRGLAESAASSFSTTDSTLPNPSVNAIALVNPRLLEINTLPHSKEHFEANNTNFEHKSQVQRSRHFRSSSFSGQDHHTTSTATRMYFARAISTFAESKSTSYVLASHANIGSILDNSRLSDNEDCMESGPQHRLITTQNPIDAHSSDCNKVPLCSISSLSPLPLSSRTAVSKNRRPESVVQLEECLERLDSVLQFCELQLAQGQNQQPLLAKQESDAIMEQMAQYYIGLGTALAENKALQIQLNDKMADVEKMTKRILELQEAQMDNDKRMLEKLALIQSKATAILIQTYEMHEFPIPRLFIILPKGDITSKLEKIETLITDRFRLYFLCECGEHTRPVSGPPSTLSHDIHLARHAGYDLDRPNEFFSKYGSYVLAIMQVLKYGVVAAGMIVPALNAMKIADELKIAQAGLKAVQKSLTANVDSTIDYLQRLTKAHEGQSKDVGNANSSATMVESTSLGSLGGLEGADLRNLATFLKGSDKDMILGNLYRTVTPEGHVKWVCLDHYRESYGADVVKEFKKSVEDLGGTYDQQTGRVAVRLESPDQARRFYITLSSARPVHELELSLDWRTSFDDLRLLKDAVQQSSISCLALDLCDKTSPKRDGIFLSHRCEPIVQIMATPKVHTLVLRNVTSFLSPTKDLFKSTTLHVRHFDLSEKIILADDFIRLENMIRASPALVRLAIVVEDVDKAFERLQLVAAEHKTFSTLELQSPGGSAATFQFELGSDKIVAIGLKVVNLNPIDSMRRPILTSIELLAKNSMLPCSQYLQSIIKQCRNLKIIKVAQLPDGGADLLRELQQAIDDYVCPTEGSSVVTKRGAGVAVIGEEWAGDLPNARAGLMELDSIHSQTVLWNMSLLVVSIEGVEAQKDTGTVLDAEPRRTKSVSSVRREDESLALVRFQLEDDGSMVLHIDDINTSRVFQHTPITKLMAIGNDGFEFFSKLMEEPATHFSDLRTLEFWSRQQDLLDILRRFQRAAKHRPTLARLKLWNTNITNMTVFTLPLRDLDLFGHVIPIALPPSLWHLLHEASTLSRLTLSVNSFSEVFNIVNSAAQLHKRLSHVQLDHMQSRLSAHFIVGSGEVCSITLHVLESEFNELLSLPKVTCIKLLDGRDISQTKELMLSAFKHHFFLNIVILECHAFHFLESIEAVHHVINKTSLPCQFILTIKGMIAKPTVLNLPLKSLVIPSAFLVKEHDLNIVKRIFQSNSGLQELQLSTLTLHIAQQIFNFIFQEHRPIERLSLQVADGPTAVFSLEEGRTGGNLTVAQKITDADRNNVSFSLSEKVGRMDVVGSKMTISQTAEIVLSALRCRKETYTFRFLGSLNRVEDVTIAIKDSLRRGLHLPVREREHVLFSSNHSTSNVYSLALFCSFHSDPRKRFSTIVRSCPGGELEAIGLEYSDSDSRTLMMNQVAFNESDFAQLSDVINLQVFIAHGPTLVKDFIRKPLEIFLNLKHLELSCQNSLQGAVLLTALHEAGTRPALEQLHMWHPDNSSKIFAFDLPIKTLDLTQFAIHPLDLRGLQKIPASNVSLSHLRLNVPSLVAAFNFVRSNVGKLGSLTQLRLHGVNRTALSVSFKAGTGRMISAKLTTTDLQSASSQDIAPVLKMLQLSDATLELISAIQYATFDNPDLQCLVFREGGADLRVKIEIPIRKIDLGERWFTVQQIAWLKRLPAMCPLLMEFQMPVASLFGLHEACRVLGPRFQALKTLSSFRLRLKNGIVTSIRFSKNGFIRSVALRIPEECVETRVRIPFVKKVSICLKYKSLWRGAEHMEQELGKVLELYPEMQTLELDGSVACPLSVLRFLQRQAWTCRRLLSPRYRHRVSETSEDLITHNLPLRKLQLGEYVLGEDELSELETLLLESPCIAEAAIAVATSAMIDSVGKLLQRMLKAYGKLEKLSIKSNDGYKIALCWRGRYLALASESSFMSRGFGTAEFQVSGTEWPLLLNQYKAKKLTIVTSPLGNENNDDSNTIIRDILSRPTAEFAQLTHLTLACPINHFFGFLSGASSYPSINRFDLQDPVDNMFIVSTTISSGRISEATVFLNKISDKDLIDTFCRAFPESHLRVMIDLDKNDHTEIDVSLDLLDWDDEKKVLGSILWDTKNVPNRRVFELLEKATGRIKVKAQCVYRVIWRPWSQETSTIAAGAGAGVVVQPYSDILGDAETVAALVKVLVRRATSFDIGYETLKPLIPVVKIETKKELVGESREEPFSLLRKYDIRVAKGPADPDVIQEFNALIHREVVYTIHDVTTTYVLPSRS
ncbi:MAG: hypothetical protein J3R72DRAFT_438587 [Linnemannia gamsii]|nr:MAG: hypothetical protein J3R72DRAFT_438587 [Linnemannia gamsii]